MASSFDPTDLDADTRAALKQDLHNLECAPRSDLRLTVPDPDTLVDALAREVFTALAVRGGADTARFLLDQIAAGRFIAQGYVKGPCGCFYGNLVIASDRPLPPAAPGYWLAVEQDGFAREIVNDINARLPYLEGWERFATPVEALLLDGYVREGQTDVDNAALAFLKRIITRYIALHPAP